MDFVQIISLLVASALSIFATRSELEFLSARKSKSEDA